MGLSALMGREALRPRRAELRQAGELLAVEAIDRAGLLITSEGAFVRVLEVRPPNPLILSAEGRARVAQGYCHLVSRLRAEERLQFYVVSRPINLDEVLARAREEVSFFSGEPPSAPGEARDPLSLSRWRLYAGMEETLRLHADDQAAVAVSHYVICPYVPPQRSAHELISELRPRHVSLRRAPLSRELEAHRRAARESLAFTDSVRAELDALSLPTRLLRGEEIVELLWARFNPTAADRARRPEVAPTEILGELDRPVELADARAAARRLKTLVASSPIDFKRSQHYAEVDRDCEQTIYAATTAERTQMGWLLGALLTRCPYTLSVHVRALDRRRERSRLKIRYRRIFTINRGSEARGRVPDFDRMAQEEESAHLLSEMASHERASLYEVSIYQSVRVGGPDPDVAALSEAVDYCAEQIHSSSDAQVNRGSYQQRSLWPATLPVGRDVAARSCKYVTRNVGDCVPLVSTSCGSPAGIPFCFSDPGRTLELLNPYDRAHENSTLLVSGRSGAGKTVCVQKILSGLIAYGARAVFVIDRSGHYEVLVSLVDGARQIELGAEDSPFALNPWDVADMASPAREKVAFLIALHAVMMGEEGLTVLERSQLGSAIREVYARCEREAEAPRESMLREVLLSRSEAEKRDGAVEIAAVLRSLADRLGEFCGQGAYSYLLDRETNVPEHSPLVVFDTRRCPTGLLGPVMFCIIEYVHARLRSERAQRAEGEGGPLFPSLACLVIEECWRVLASQDGGTYVNDLARRARHLGLVLVVVSQQLTDFDVEHGRALLRNCSQALLLKMEAAELSAAREALELTEEQAQIVSRLKTVKGAFAEIFWINGTRGQARVTLRLGPTEYWCFTSEPLSDVPTREAAIERHEGALWPAIRELAEGGLPQGGGG